MRQLAGQRAGLLHLDAGDGTLALELGQLARYISDSAIRSFTMSWYPVPLRTCATRSASKSPTCASPVATARCGARHGTATTLG